MANSKKYTSTICWHGNTPYTYTYRNINKNVDLFVLVLESVKDYLLTYNIYTQYNIYYTYEYLYIYNIHNMHKKKQSSGGH